MLNSWYAVRVIFPSVIALVAILTIQFSSYSLFDFLNVKDEPKISFLTEWYDSTAGSTRRLLLTYFSSDHSVELFDSKAKRPFLKRHVFEDLEESDFYIGNSVVILTRQLKLVDYADSRTRGHIEHRRQRTFAMIKPDAVHKVGEIIELIQSRDFTITQLRMTELSPFEAQEFYAEHKGRSFFNPLVDYITSGKIIALELTGKGAVENWRGALGPTDSQEARTEAPESIRAIFGKDKQQNAAHGSDSAASVKRELDFFFYGSSFNREDRSQSTTCSNSTCCVIKPHAIKAGNLGAILMAVKEEGFTISALQMFRMDKMQAEEFLEVYKEVVNEYPRMVHQFVSGPLVALEITSAGGESIPQTFREFVGPVDPEVAKELRPQSLRARFGEDKVRNAIHCTDLPEDVTLELEYFFKILRSHF